MRQVKKKFPVIRVTEIDCGVKKTFAFATQAQAMLTDVLRHKAVQESGPVGLALGLEGSIASECKCSAMKKLAEEEGTNRGTVDFVNKRKPKTGSDAACSVWHSARL